MEGADLNENEKQVLLGIVREPMATDRELSESLGLKLPTITSIRHRLEKEGYFFSSIWMPNLAAIGCKLVTVLHATYSASVATPKRLKLFDEIAERNPYMVWCLSEPGQHVSIQFSRDFTDVKRNLDLMEEALTRAGMVDENGIQPNTFPLELCDRLRIFDFTPTLEKLFGMKPEGRSSRGWYKSTTDIYLEDLGETERRVFRGMVQAPRVTNRELARELSLSPSTVDRARNRLVESGLIKKTVIPDLLKLGFSMMVFSHARFNLNLSHKKRNEVIESVLDVHPSFFVLKNAIEAVSIEAYLDFEEYKRTVSQLSSIYEQHNIFQHEPTRLFFSIPVGKTVKEYDYSQLVEKCE